MRVLRARASRDARSTSARGHSPVSGGEVAEAVRALGALDGLHEAAPEVDRVASAGLDELEHTARVRAVERGEQVAEGRFTESRREEHPVSGSNGARLAVATFGQRAAQVAGELEHERDDDAEHHDAHETCAVRIARRAPRAPPRNCAAAMGSATSQRTTPRCAKMARAARFEAKLTTFALALARVKASCIHVTYAMMRKVPVPGPKKPS